MCVSRGRDHIPVIPTPKSLDDSGESSVQNQLGPPGKILYLKKINNNKDTMRGAGGVS